MKKVRALLIVILAAIFCAACSVAEDPEDPTEVSLSQTQAVSVPEMEQETQTQPPVETRSENTQETETTAPSEPSEPVPSESVPSDTSDVGLEMPDEMKQYLGNEALEWMVGMLPKLTNCTMSQQKIEEYIDIYSCTEDTIQAEVILQNGIDLAQPYFFMVFADGAPVEFELGGETYLSYPLELEGGMRLEIEFRAEFSQQLGRLDFLLFFDGNPKSDFHMSAYTIWVERSEEVQLPSVLRETIPQRGGLMGSFSGGSYGAWLYSSERPPTRTDNVGPRGLTIPEDGSVLFEAVASRPGLYRTVLVLDGQPISFTIGGEQASYLDWESAGSDMLQLPIELPVGDGEGGSFFAVTTPLELDAISTQSLASTKSVVEFFKD